MTTKPDFSAMKLTELLAAFNLYSTKPRKAAFGSKAEGVKACEKAYAAHEAQAVADKPAKAAKAPKAPKAAKSTKKAGGTRSDRAEKLIVVDAPQNPYRVDSLAYAHFAKAQKAKSVGDYLSKFDEGKPRRNASQWLWNFSRDGNLHTA